MKLSKIDKRSLSESTNRDLLNLHYRIHQLYRLCEIKKSNLDVRVLKEKHKVIVSEMTSRNIRHTTNLEHAIEAIFS